MNSRQVFAVLSIFPIAFSSSPARLSLTPPPAQAASRVTCASVDFGYSYCRTSTGRGVRLTEQLSRAPCIQGRTWGSDSRGIWVDRGCSATFSVSDGSGAAGAVIGAAIIGGILGAALSDDHRRPPHRYSNTTVTNIYTRDRYVERDRPSYSRDDGNRYRDPPDDGNDGGGGGRRDEADDGDTGGGGGGYYDGDRDEGGGDDGE